MMPLETPGSCQHLKLLNRPCPICNNDRGEVLHTQHFALPKGHILPGSYGVVSCSKCGFVYADTTARQEDYDSYYRDFSKYEDITVSSGTGTAEWDRNRLRETAESIVGKLVAPSASILDIGCANGGLLSALREMSCDHLTGLDPSPVCVSYVSKLGIECYEGGLFDHKALPAGNKFDCVILSHVLEHVCALQRAVDVIKEIVQDGGLIYIEVPDASRYKDFYIVPYYYFDCEHINHFDEHSLHNLFCRTGCVTVSTIKKSIPVSAANLYPVLGVLLRKTGNLADSSIALMPDFSVKSSVKKYISLSSERSRYAEIDALAHRGEPVVVWGAGSYTLRLLETTSLGSCSIHAFIDKDTSKQGRQIKGVSIFPPQKLYEMACPIVVCAALYSSDIIEEIRAMGLPNRVVVA